jgi:hypothetical protein
LWAALGSSAEPAAATRLDVSLDPEHAAKLTRMGEQAYTQEGTLARSLLARAIDEVGLDGGTVVELLNGISAPSGARLGRSRDAAAT